MIPELGHLALSIALALSFLQCFSGFYGAYKSNLSIFRFSKNIVFMINFLVLFAFLSLIYSYASSDFSVENVALNSHSNKPMLYKISGTWSNHEGSLMMWLAILSFYGFAVTRLSSNIPYKLVSRIIGVQGVINSGFLGFAIFTSNPFLRLFPSPSEGNGLNPVLQDPGLAFHPPLLYIGYVGLCIPFAFAIGALIEGRVNSAWAKWIRPWVLVSWIFLTLGITLGSWWAYYELGWGGWWFWDPVENVSLLPWLLATALLHSSKIFF